MNVKELKSYEILIRENAGECEKYSAEALTKYIKKTCKISLKTVSKKSDGKKVFSIGETPLLLEKSGFDRSTLNHDGFRIFTEDGNIFFDSLTVRGVMYAVYDFIERELGVRFLTAKAEHVPTVKEIDLKNINRVTEPEFEMSSYNGGGDIFGQKIERCNFDFFSKMRAKEVFTKIPEKYGGPIKIFGRNTAHNFAFYVPHDKYLNNHPDWYRFFWQHGGLLSTIDITNGITDDGKLDESMSESVVKAVIDEMKKDMDAYPEVEIFMLTQEDGPYYYDDEHNRALEKKYGRGGILIRFINVVAREMQKYADEKYPGRKVRLMTFAYSYASKAPVKKVGDKFVPIDSTVKADDNVIIQLALSGNGYFSYFDDRQIESTRASMEEWYAIAKEFWFWAYDTNWHRYGYFFDSFHNVKENLLGWKNMGITYLFVESAANHGHWQVNLRGYMYRQLMKDLKRDEDEVMNEYIHYYYGPAEEYIKRFIKMYHENYEDLIEKQGEDVVFAIRTSAEEVKYTPTHLIYKSIDLLHDAENEVKNAKISAKEKKEYLRRLACVMLTPLTMKNDRFYERFPDATEAERIASNNELIEYYKKTEEKDMEVGSRTSMWEYFEELRVQGEEHERQKQASKVQ